MPWKVAVGDLGERRGVKSSTRRGVNEGGSILYCLTLDLDPVLFGRFFFQLILQSILARRSAPGYTACGSRSGAEELDSVDLEWSGGCRCRCVESKFERCTRNIYSGLHLTKHGRPLPPFQLCRDPRAAVMLSQGES